MQTWTAKMGHAEQDILNRTGRTGKSKQDRQNRTSRTEEAEQNWWNRTGNKKTCIYGKPTSQIKKNNSTSSTTANYNY
jgi:hypothetical protein